MIDTFDIAFEFIELPQDDGQPLHITPGDPGGATEYGATFNRWAEWRRSHNLPATMDIFQSLQKSDLAPFYLECFWEAARCDDVPPSVALGLFDAGVLSGPDRAIRFLQVALGIPADGQFGRVTLAAVEGVNDLVELVHRYCLVRGAFYDELRNAPKFGKGWHRRAADCERLALTLIPQAPLPPSDADALNEAELRKMGDME